MRGPGLPRSTTGRCRPNTPRTRSPTPWAASSPTIRCRPRTSWTSSCGPATRDSPPLPSGRFFGFVIGGSHPAAIAADWLTTVWDQNAGLRALTPASAALEEVAGAWILEALNLPPESAVGYVTGGTTANFTCLATGRDAVLRTAGYDVSRRPRRAPAGAGRGRCRAARVDRSRGALPRPRNPGVRAGGRPGPDPARRARTGARRPVRLDDRCPPGRQHPLRSVRPVPGVHRDRQTPWRVDPRRRRVRVVGRRVAELRAPDGPDWPARTPGRPMRTRR